MMRGYVKYAAGLAALVIVCVGLLLATWSVHPGEVVLLMRGGKVVATYQKPGLHWKIPLVESIVRLDARTQLAEGSVRPTPASTSGLAARYAVFWRIADPANYYRTTGGDPAAFGNQLQAAVKPVLARAMAESDAKTFLSGPATALDARIEAAVRPAAKKDGIAVLGVHLGAADIPPRLATEVAGKMAAGTRADIAAAKAAGEVKRQAIMASAAQSAAAAVAAARAPRRRAPPPPRRKAAHITGASEAKVTAIYAPVARKAPGFFDYFLTLESEAGALKQNTRVLVLSMDSPWFKTLEKPGEKPRQ